MEVNQYIKDLLFTHDSVIISGLGGFEAKYQPAKINPADNTMLPPTKEIAFNAQLTQDDGLLANYLVSKENITTDEAKKKIEDFVKSCNEKLAAGEKVAFTDIGELSTDAQKNLVFTPLVAQNLLSDSFGLSPVKVSSDGQKTAVGAENMVVVTDDAAKKKRLRSILIYSLIALPLILLIVLFIWKFDWIRNETVALKESWFGDKTEVADNTKNTNNNTNSNTNNNNNTTKDKVVKKDSIIKINPDKKDKNKKDSKADQAEKDLNSKMKVVKTTTKNNSAKAKYYLIAGSFKTKANADKLKKVILGMGFKAEIMPTEDKMFRVTIGWYNKAEDAVKEYEKFHAANKEIDLWLLQNQ